MISSPAIKRCRIAPGSTDGAEFELGRQSDISIVKANNAEAPGGKAVTERLRPGNHLRGKTHDEDDGRIASIASVVVCDLNSIG